MEVLREGYRIPFLRPPPLSTEPIPMPSYAPTSIKGAALEEVTLALIAKGAVELAPLPSPGFYSRLFVVWKTSGVVETGHRPVSPQPLRGCFTLPHGDHPVRSSVCPSGGLDGLHRPSGSVSAGSCPSGISSLPPLCGTWPLLPVQSAVFWSVHGPSGLHSGYGSCICDSSFLRYPYASLPPPVLGRSPGVRVSSMVHSTSGVGEASGVPSDPPHPGRPLLASAAMVRGPPSDVGGSSGDSSFQARPPLPATVSSALPGSQQAGPSCLETIQRFTRAAGFSSAVAAQASLARRPSSRSSYQLKWSVYRSWCQSQGQGGGFPMVAPLCTRS